MAKGKAMDEAAKESSASRIFALSERLNQLLLKELDADLWMAAPAGGVRTIAGIFSHMHNVRVKWVRLTAPYLELPARLDRRQCTREAASEAFSESALACRAMLEDSIGSRAGRIEKFHRDGWTPAWPVGPEMLAYMTSHEAHHRGQIGMLAHQFGRPLTSEAMSHSWSWEKLWKEIDGVENQ